MGWRWPGSDDRLELLANNGNGVYGFVDSAAEAKKILVDEVDGTLATVAKDVKIQVEFNRDQVSSYRLIGYENRALEKEDFNDTGADAGEVGSGHTVTALYEIEPADNRAKKRAFAKADNATADRMLTVKVRYKQPFGDEETRTLEFPLVDEGADFSDADEDFRFAASVAAWGMLLRESPYAGTASFDQVRDWAEECLSHDPGGYREEFISIVRDSKSLGNRR